MSVTQSETLGEQIEEPHSHSIQQIRKKTDIKYQYEHNVGQNKIRGAPGDLNAACLIDVSCVRMDAA